jgi:ribonuclease HI
MKQEKEIKVFYTDGACSGNPGKGGFGVVQMGQVTIPKRNQLGNIEKVTLPSIEYSYDKHSDLTTNNREELKAIIHVMKLAAADPRSEYLVYSDSAYAVNMINNWIWSWAKNNWCNSKHKEVENIDLVKEIYKYLTIDFFNCQVKKCSGHSGELGNELADALATGNGKKMEKLLEDNEILILNHSKYLIT